MSDGKEEGKDVLNVEQISPVAMAQTLLEKGVKPEDVEKMLTLQERYDANQAKKAFAISMVEVQKNMPIVPELATNSQTNSKYSKYKTILKYTKHIYTEAGFSLVYSEGETSKEDNIRVVVDIMHSQGHIETRFIDVPLDLTGLKGTVNKTKTHAKGSSLSYGKGYLIRMVFNIPTGDDDDGQAAGSIEYISEEQLSTIRDFIDNNEAVIEKSFLEHMGAESCEQLPKAKYQQAIVAIKEVIAHTEKEAK